MLKKMIVTGFCATFSAAAFAQSDSVSRTTQPAGGFSIHGAMDGYYKYDFSRPPVNGLTSFTQTQNRFELGMASATLQYETAKTQMVLDLGFGKRAQDFSYTDNGILACIKQAYISYTPIKNITVTAGSWATHIGYELLDAYQNGDYSMSYLFSTGPFSHTGIKATYSTGKHSFMLGIANPTDYKYVPENVINKKFILAQYHFAGGEKFDFYLNYAGGQWVDTSKSQQMDLVATSHFSSRFWIAINGTLGLKKLWQENAFTKTKNWWGIATYLNADFTKRFGATLREEYFNDKNSLTAIPLGGNVWASTLSFNFKINDCFTLIPECRVDAASQPIFQKSNGSSAKTDANILLAAVYNF